MLGAFALMALTLSAQDIHFSQFNNTPINLNPGLAGVFGGDMRFVGNYRSQWRSVRVPYTTYSGTFENKIYPNRGVYNKYFTAGLLINYDRQGSLELTSLQIGVPISYTLPVTGNSFLSLGVTPAFGQRAFNSHQWSFDAQFVDCLYNPSAPTLEDGSLFSTNLQYFDLNAGLNYRLQSDGKRSRLDLGGAFHHINRPKHDFWSNSGEVKLAVRKSFYGIGLVQVSDNFDLTGQLMYQEQGTYREFLYGAGARIMLSTQQYDELAIQVGAFFRQRYTDAVVAHAEIFYRTWSLGFSYDINFSDFTKATDYRGGPEVSLIYRLYKNKAVYQKCPID